MTAAASSAPLPAGTASLDSLRAAAARDPKAAIRETARQFEAVFMNELMKSMRSTTMSSGLFDNSGTAMGTDMLDQQYATQMTGRPGGLADLIARQLERSMGVVPAAPGAGAAASPRPPMPGGVMDTAPARGASPHTGGTPAAGSAALSRLSQGTHAEAFVRRHAAAADAAAAETGIPAAFILAQAAHESGWGRREIVHADGSPAHNLFGIKAGPGWQGATTEVTTTEYVNGQPRRQVASFRAYGSYEESFRDWARMLRSNPRYAGVVAGAGRAPDAEGAASFAQGLQDAGYATDPQYADKLSRVINTTLRLRG